MPFSILPGANVFSLGMVPQSAGLVELCHVECRDDSTKNAARRTSREITYARLASDTQAARRIDVLEFLRIVNALEGDPRAVFMDIVARRAGSKTRKRGPD
jgi:hypothetical protein